MKRKLLFVMPLAFLLSISFGYGQKSYWTQTKQNSNRSSKLANLDTSHYQTFELNVSAFKQQLNGAPLRENLRGKSSTIVSFPNTEGVLEDFRVVEAPVLSEELSEQFPNIKTYLGVSLDGSGKRVRFSVTPQGVQTMTSYLDKPTVFTAPITKNSNQYITYTRNARINSIKDFECLTEDEYVPIETNGLTNRDANDQTLRTFRIAISTTGEYTNFWDDGDAGNGNAQEDALAQVVSTLNRTNEVFEVDMAINFSLVSGTSIIYPNAGTDPYTNNPNGQLQNTLTINVGEANYDIGHLFMLAPNNGNAGCIGCVCQNGTKGSAFSAHQFTDNDGGPYMSDFFDIDYVPHEIGHQMGATHTYSHINEGTGTNVEPGSGTTIMGYAGITGPNDVQNHSDPYFNFFSIAQILNNVASAPNNCWNGTTITNDPPVANAGSDYTIPNGTAFILKGSATDPDGGDQLTYCWEQLDTGTTTSGNFGPTKTSGSLWRSRPPSTSTDRYMPTLQRVLNGQLTQSNPGISADNSTWETVSTIGRGLDFGLTVRDRSEAGGTGQMPQSDFDTMTVTVSGAAGPFAVTSQTTENETLNSGATETITWDVAGTTANGINTANVNILLSTDGGQNFDTVLVSNTPNDGTQDIVIPDIPAPFCRIMVEAVGNIFYAVNPVSFSIDYEVAVTCDQYASGDNLGIAIPDGIGANQPGNAVFSTINIPDDVVYSSLRVNVDVSHTYINDLIIQLQHPDGNTFTNLWQRNCDSEDNLDIIFEDGAAAIACASPTVGTYAPANSMSGFDGLSSLGDWNLALVDFWNGDLGTLNDWYIELCSMTVTPLSVDEFNTNDFTIYPNPNNGTFNIKFSNANASTSIDVFDVRGRLVFNNIYESSGEFDEVIDLGNAQSGMYLVRIDTGNSSVTKRIIIE
ncbi:reprolysin-like metallopeptidase [Winogradskyella sp. 3972H.M.0a.05]|uniref:zinc-dependent metalloprotease n=1 Tax=Winogradskyella sp. 3972H.M.0a.05 TaxID=2950277 RepID=UPI00339A9C2E